ncbi:MAG: DNA-binding protein [Thermoplasmatota archaeon]
MEWTEKISKWLTEGKDGAELLIDYPWDIQTSGIEGQPDKTLITASHPKIPFNVEVVVGKHFANLVINPIIPTDAMEATERMRIYKKLLHLNSDLNLMKAGLIGYEDNPIIQVDLDLNSLGKEEFNDALTLLIVGAHNLIKILGLTEEMQEFMANRFLAIVAVKLQSGESEESILDFLVHRGGLDEESAKNLLQQTNSLLEQRAKEEAEGPHSEPGPMYG